MGIQWQCGQLSLVLAPPRHHHHASKQLPNCTGPMEHGNQGVPGQECLCTGWSPSIIPGYALYKGGRHQRVPRQPLLQVRGDSHGQCGQEWTWVKDGAIQILAHTRVSLCLGTSYALYYAKGIRCKLQPHCCACVHRGQRQRSPMGMELEEPRREMGSTVAPASGVSSEVFISQNPVHASTRHGHYQRLW